MGLLDGLRRWVAAKATGGVDTGTGGPGAEQLWVDFLRAAAGISDGAKRASAGELIKRYAQWTYRCLNLNAVVAAAIQPRLFVIGRSPDVMKLKAVGPQRPDRRTIRLIKGRTDLEVGGRAKAAIRGNEDDLTEITRHPLLDLLNDVNPWDDGCSHREAWYRDRQLFGEWYDRIVTDGSGGAGTPIELWRVRPRDIAPIPHPKDFVSGFKRQIGHGRTEMLDVDEVLWHRIPDPDNPWGVYGPVEAWLTEIDAGFAISTFQDELFKKHGSPDWVAISKLGWTEPQRKKFRKDYSRLFGRFTRRKHSVMMLGGEVDFKALQQSPKELQFKDGRTSVRDFVSSGLGVPKALVTSDDVNRAVAREGSITHLRNTIWPMIRANEDYLNERLVPRFGDRLVLIHDNPLQEEREQLRLESAAKLSSGYSIDEVRTNVWGDEPLETEASQMPMVSSTVKPLERVVAPPPPPAPPPGPGDGGNNDDGEDGGQDGGKTARTGLASSSRPGPDETGGDGGHDGDDAEEARRAATSRPSPCPCCEATARSVGLARLIVASLKDADDPALAEDRFSGEPDKAFAEDIARTLAGFIRDVERRVAEDKTYAAPQTKKDPPGLERIGVWLSDEVTSPWIESMNGAAKPHLSRMMADAGQQALRQVGSEISFDLLNTRTQDALAQAGERLANSSVSSLRGHIAAELQAGISEGESVSQLTARLRDLGDLAGDKSLVRWKAEQIVRTETAFSQMDATLEGWKQSGVVTGYKFELAPDACPWCISVAQKANEAVFPLDQPVLALGSELTAEFPLAAGGTTTRSRQVTYAPVFGTPIHPGCRCSISPVLS